MLLLLLLLLLLLSIGHHLTELADQLHWHREHNSLVVLNGDVGQGLEVPQLKHKTCKKDLTISNLIRPGGQRDGQGLCLLPDAETCLPCALPPQPQPRG